MSKTTFMKKYPVVCVWARSLIQKYCRVFIHFAFVVWTSFSERMANLARLPARNVAERSKLLEVDILKTCRPIFEWIVCRMLWIFNKKCNIAGVKSGNCEKTSAKFSYCFKRCAFWCDDCIAAYNVIRVNKDHRVLAIKDVQDQDN